MLRIATPKTARKLHHRSGARSALLAGAATLSIVLGAGAARAECVTTAEGQVVCTGTTGGYVSDVEGNVVTVASGAVVATEEPGAAAVRYDQGGDLVVHGQVSSATGAGVRIASPWGDHRIRVSAGGSITAEIAIASDRGAGHAIQLDNSGTVRGTDVAIESEDGSLDLRNARHAAIIGGIDVYSLSGSNDGLIDGGDRAALRGRYIDFENRGTITGAPSDGASTVRGTEVRLVNRGTISATTGGAAIDAEFLQLVNHAGGVIRATGGGAAIDLGISSFAPFAGQPEDYDNNIDNAGQIIGDVRGHGTTRDRFFQRIGGTVTGNIDLGGGDDAFWYEQGAAPGTPGVSGTISGGEGIDVLGIRMTRSGTITFGSLPAGFERYGVDLCGCNIEATIAAGQTLTGGLDVIGAGRVTNLADMNYTGAGPAIDISYSADAPDGQGGLTFVNRGTLNLVGVDADALILSEGDSGSGRLGEFANEGTILLSGDYSDGIRIAGASSPDGYAFSNSGTIRGSGNIDSARSVFFTGRGRNSGTIVAEGSRGIGVEVHGWDASLENAAGGRIAGEGTGVQLSAGANLRNGGLIEGGTEDGVVVTVQAGIDRSRVINDAGGTIRGGNGVGIYAWNAPDGVLVANHGRIEGDIIASNGDDVIWLAEGSTVTGGITGGDGLDTLVVDIGRASQAGGTGALDLSGIIDGAVNMSSSTTLWLRAGTSQTANVLPQPVDGFADTVYESAGAATELTLRGPLDSEGNADPYQGTLKIAGDGRIVIDMDLNNSGLNASSIQVQRDSTASWFDDNSAGPDVALSGVVSGGTGAVHVDAFYARRFELVAGAGEIDMVGGIGLHTGYGTEVVLNGNTRIRGLSSSTAQRGTLLVAEGSNVYNRGSITEDIGTATADNVMTGVRLSEGGTLYNQRTSEGVGRISVQGNAVELEEGTIVNDGEISSTHGDAIHGTSGVSRVVNGTRGVISGHTQGSVTGTAGAAITSDAGSMTVENLGVINGHVLLGRGADTYIAAGGTVAGNLDLGEGDDTLLVRDGAATGVSGTITAGSGRDAYGKSFTASGVFDLGANAMPSDFELHAVEAVGANTEVTVNAAATQDRSLRILGDGKVTNNANITVDGFETAIEAYGTGSLINNGNVSGNQGITVYANLSSFQNNGRVIGSERGVDFSDRGLGEPTGGTAFRNEGEIRGLNGSAVVIEWAGTDADGRSLDFVNAGQIVAEAGNSTGVGAYLGARGGLRFANGGTIESASTRGTGLRLDGDGLVEASNIGTIRATGAGGTGISLTANGLSSLRDEEDCIDPENPTLVLVAALANSGTISANGGGQVDGETGRINLASGLFVRVGDDYGVVRVDNAAGGVIEATGPNSAAVLVQGEAGNRAAGSAEARYFVMDNAGTIRGGADTSVDGRSIRAEGYDIGDSGKSDGVIAGAIHTMDTNDYIRNLAGGTIIGNVDLGNGDDVFENLGSLQGDLRLGEGDDAFVYSVASAFTGTAWGGEGSDTLVVDATGGGSINFDQFRGFEALTQRGTGAFGIRGTTDLATLNIANVDISIAAGTRFDTAGGLALSASATEATNERINVSGTVGGGISLGAGNDIVNLLAGGLVEGDINMGAGDDYVGLAGGTVTGQVDGGDGIDTIGFRINGNTSNLPNVVNFESLDVDGEGRLTLAMNQDFDTVILRNGADLTLDPGNGDHTIGNILGDDSAQDVVLNTRLTGGVHLGGGDDSLTMGLSGTLSGALIGGEGNDTLNLNLTGASRIADGVSFETINVSGSSPLTLGGTIAANQTLNFDGGDNHLIIDGGSVLGTVNGGAGRDRLTFDMAADGPTLLNNDRITGFEDLEALGEGELRLGGAASYLSLTVDQGDLTLVDGASLTAGAVTFGGADNVLTLGAGATIAGPVDGGAGSDSLVLYQAANQTRLLGSLNFTGFEHLTSRGGGELRIDMNAAFDSVTLEGARLTIDQGATLTTPTLLGDAGASVVDVRGTLAGNVDLGAGDDRLIIAGLNSVTGTRTGGDGIDTLEFRTTGSYAAPVSWDGTGYAGFERLDVSAGVVSLTGNVSYAGVRVSGGRLIGQAGTTISSTDTIVVAAGAIFGSAGTVNGNIQVFGGLAPGASPGTMTVNGNVAFAAGSHLFLEVSNARSDLLNISGTLTIAQGATMDITGILSATPGGALDLVVAQGGITGGFTTINRSDTIFGFLATRGNRIQIVGEFNNEGVTGTNALNAIRYANLAVGSSQMVQAFTGALPALVGTTGRANATAFAQLTPEAFASASQLGIDNGLAVIDVTRGAQYTAPEKTGLYGFGKVFTYENKLDGVGGSGASNAFNQATGLMGGIGYASQAVRVGAFVGSLDGKQKLAPLAANTESKGMFGGVFADAWVGGIGVHATLAYDGSEATTNRSLPAGNGLRSSYDLGGWIADLSAEYGFDMGAMRVAPHAGFTYLQGQRGGVSEQGVVNGQSGNVFALQVNADRSISMFADAGIAASGTAKVAGMGLRAFVDLGIRQYVSGADKQSRATAEFRNASGIGVLGASGVGREDTSARLATGLSLDIAKHVRLEASYAAEFNGATRQSLTGGLTIGF